MYNIKSVFLEKKTFSSNVKQSTAFFYEWQLLKHTKT